MLMPRAFGSLLCGAWHGVQKVELLQGYFGAPSVKPTTFMVVHGPEKAGEVLNKFRSRDHLPKAASIGKDSKGAYKTARLKEYPSALCKAIWGLIEHHLTNRGFSTSLIDTDGALLEAVQHLEARLDHRAEHMGPDYHPVAL